MSAAAPVGIAWLAFTPAYSSPRRSTRLAVLGAHAFRSGASRSLCGYVERERAGGDAAVTARRCEWCKRVVAGRAADRSAAPAAPEQRGAL